MKNRLVKGFSIAELMVASFSFLLVMLVALGALRVVQRTSRHLKGRSVPRQQLRVLLGNLQREIRAANFVYDANGVLSFGAESHSFSGGPSADPSLPPVQEVAFATPETASPATTYKVSGLFLQPEPRGAFAGAHSIVLGEVKNLVGLTPGTPADIPLAALPPAGAGLRKFRTASPADGMRIRLSQTLDGLTFEFVIGHKTEGESVLFETYQANFTMRNNR